MQKLQLFKGVKHLPRLFSSVFHLWPKNYFLTLENHIRGHAGAELALGIVQPHFHAEDCFTALATVCTLAPA